MIVVLLSILLLLRLSVHVSGDVVLGALVVISRKERKDDRSARESQRDQEDRACSIDESSLPRCLDGALRGVRQSLHVGITAFAYVIVRA